MIYFDTCHVAKWYLGEPDSPRIRAEAIAAAIAALPPQLLIRAIDALHLTCSREHGFGDIHTSDRHMLAAAPYFGLNGIKL